jgi:hypothetical protein
MTNFWNVLTFSQKFTDVSEKLLPPYSGLNSELGNQEEESLKNG